MLSAGNDIVSLEEINVSRTVTKQFYSKILSAAEVTLYEKTLPADVIPFEKYVWLLWSVKESAYKFLKRLDPALVFTPVKFEVKQLTLPADFSVSSFYIETVKTGFGEVAAITSRLKIGKQQVYTCSIIYPGFILSVANGDENFDAVYWGVKKIGESDHVVQSQQVREFLYKRAAIITGRNELTINKDKNGIPLLYDGTEELPLAVSLAHHGEYVGYSFIL